LSTPSQRSIGSPSPLFGSRHGLDLATRGPFSIVLVEPKIPPNLGAVSRTCAATGAPLYIVGPVTFREDHPARRRAGLDYWDLAEKIRVDDWPAFVRLVAENPSNGRLVLFTKKADSSLFEYRFRHGDFLVFGSETDGLSDEVLATPGVVTCRIPMREGIRSLNLATATGIALYEAIRQVTFENGDGEGMP